MAFTHNNKTDDNEPDWSELDKTKLPRIAHADMGEADKKSTWKYPHHHIKDGGSPDDDGVYTTGTMYLNKAGLNAAWAAAQGARSGKEASDEVKAHLQKHRKALGLDEEKDEARRTLAKLRIVNLHGILLRQQLAHKNVMEVEKFAKDHEDVAVLGELLGEEFEGSQEEILDKTRLMLRRVTPHAIETTLAKISEELNVLGRKEVTTEDAYVAELTKIVDEFLTEPKQTEQPESEDK